jgi:hypothetical protein
VLVEEKIDLLVLLLGFLHLQQSISYSLKSRCFNMTIKNFYLVGLDRKVYGQHIHIDQYHDFEALQVAIAEQYNIIQAGGEYTVRPLPQAHVLTRTQA